MAKLYGIDFLPRDIRHFEELTAWIGRRGIVAITSGRHAGGPQRPEVRIARSRSGRCRGGPLVSPDRHLQWGRDSGTGQAIRYPRGALPEVLAEEDRHAGGCIAVEGPNIPMSFRVIVFKFASTFVYSDRATCAGKSLGTLAAVLLRSPRKAATQAPVPARVGRVA